MDQTLAEIIAEAEEYIERMLDNCHAEDDVFIREQKTIIKMANELARLVDNTF